ncbi:MAG: hypothetical protein HY438_01420 [DPANN group archaeon]|nr:hypothetical protein [DPANN group archaeon]
MPPALPTPKQHAENCACAIHFYARSVEPALALFDKNRTDDSWTSLKNLYKMWRVKAEAELQINSITISRLEGLLDSGTVRRLEDVIGLLEEQTDDLTEQYENLARENAKFIEKIAALEELNAGLKSANTNLREKTDEASSKINGFAQETRRQLEQQHSAGLLAEQEKITQLETRLREYEKILVNYNSLAEKFAALEAENNGLFLRIQLIEREHGQEITQIKEELDAQYVVREQELIGRLNAEHSGREEILKAELEKLIREKEASRAVLEEAKTWQERIKRVRSEEEELARQRVELKDQSSMLADFRDIVTLLGGTEQALDGLAIEGTSHERRQDNLFAQLDEKKRKLLEKLVNVETRAGKISSGFARLDEILQDGFPVGVSVAIVGPAHSPKDRMIYGLAINSEQKGAPTLLITTAARPNDIRAEIEKMYGKPTNNIDIFDAYNEDKDMHFGKIFVEIEGWLARISSESKLLRPRIILHTYDRYSSTTEYQITGTTGSRKVSLQMLRDLITDSNALLVCTMDQNRYAERREEWARIEDTFACMITLKNKPVTGTNMLGQMTVQARGFTLKPNALAKELTNTADLDYKIEPVGLTIMPALKRER